MHTVYIWQPINGNLSNDRYFTKAKLILACYRLVADFVFTYKLWYKISVYNSSTLFGLMMSLV